MEHGGIVRGITNYRPAGKRVVSARNHRKNWKPKNSSSKTARRNVRLQHGDQCQCSCGSVDTHPISGGESLRRSLQTGTDAAILVQPSQPERKQPGVLRVRHTRRVASLIIGENGNPISLLLSPISHTLPLARYAVAPPHELPAPAVQPKQWSAKTIRRASSASKSQSKIVCGAADPTGKSSIWLKSQSLSRPS